MVRVINGNTGWDLPSHAGKYVVLDIGDFTFQQWLLLNMRHIVDYTRAVDLPPDPAQGVLPLPRRRRVRALPGRPRATSSRTASPPRSSYFEPWNQQRFDPSEPFISAGAVARRLPSYRANLAHPLHNIGV